MGTIFSVIYSGISSVAHKITNFMNVLCKKAKYKNSFWCSCHDDGGILSKLNIFKLARCGVLMLLLILIPIGLGVLIFYELPVIVQGFEWIISSLESLFSFMAEFATDFEFFTQSMMSWIFKAKDWITTFLANIGDKLGVDYRLVHLTVYSVVVAFFTTMIADIISLISATQSTTSAIIYNFLRSPITWLENWLGTYSKLLEWGATIFFVPFSMVIYGVSFILGLIIDLIRKIL